MKRISRTLAKLGSVAALALGAVAVTSTGFAASPSSATTVRELQAQSEHHAMMASDYRARMRTDEKHAIARFTQANHCEQKAEELHVASLQPGAQGVAQRDSAVL